MNRQPFQTPPQAWDPKLAPWLVRLWRPLRRRTLRHTQRLTPIEVRGAEPVRKALDEGAGVLITPNHSFHYDSYVLMEAAEQLGRPPHVMAAWQVFAMGGRFQSWVMQKHGCFSIDREGSDMRAFRLAVDLLKDSPHPLVIFPEGEIYHTNDRVTPFREGAAAIALAAAKKATRRIVCVPCALKYWYTTDPTPSLLGLMERLERRLLLRPQSDRPLAERVYRFAEAILSLKELEYLGHPQSGTLPERIGRMKEALLTRLEQRYGLAAGAGTVPERIKEVRRHIIKRQEQADLTDADRKQLADDLEDVFGVVQLFSYPGNYVAERPSIERLAETLDKFEEDVLGEELPAIRGTRRVVVSFGEPVEVPRERGRKDAVAYWTDDLEKRVQALLDGLNAEQPAHS
jgi:1-acyl-sn-glycerol-3-phosphate acyltransferase